MSPQSGIKDRMAQKTAKSLKSMRKQESRFRAQKLNKNGLHKSRAAELDNVNFIL